jgi:hypothetical protein
LALPFKLGCHSHLLTGPVSYLLMFDCSTDTILHYHIVFSFFGGLFKVFPGTA